MPARPGAVSKDPHHRENSEDLLAQYRQPEVSTVPFVKQLSAVLGRELGAGPKGAVWGNGRPTSASASSR
jgi:hypothetical protein